MSIFSTKWYANQAIDTIQGAKTVFLKSVVTDETYRAPLQTFVDSQTKFAKDMVGIVDEFFAKNIAEFQKAAK